jgi:hypothetical protein
MAADEFQHLSRMTALRELAVSCPRVQTDHLSGLQHLSQLTNLYLHGKKLAITSNNIQGCACLTGLQRLTLTGCDLQPGALTDFTQLRSLTLKPGKVSEMEQVLAAASELILLTDLVLQPRDPQQPDPQQLDPQQLNPEQLDPQPPNQQQPDPQQPDPQQLDPQQPDPQPPNQQPPNQQQPDPQQLDLPQPDPQQPDPQQADPQPPGTLLPPSPPAAAFTALTASSNLCSLKLGLRKGDAPQGYILFRPGTVYSQLRTIHLQHHWQSEAWPLTPQQLAQLCSCCPALQDLAVVLQVGSDVAATALLPAAAVSADTVAAGLSATHRAHTISRTVRRTVSRRSSRTSSTTSSSNSSSSCSSGRCSAADEAQAAGRVWLFLADRASPAAAHSLDQTGAA